MDVKIYLQTDIKSVSKKKGYGIYILEASVKGKNATLTKGVDLGVRGKNEAELYLLSKAAERIKRNSHVVLFTDSGYISSALINGWIKDWVKNGWKKKDGSDVAHSDLWQKITSVIDCYSMELRFKENHTYKNWMISELQRKEKKDHEENIRLQSIQKLQERPDDS